jgi:hypothetical protein
MRRVAVGSLALVIAALSAPTAEPCCMVPAGYKGSISQSGQEAILFHDQGREDLILKIHYEIRGDAMPDRFAWIITVPNEPDGYAVADPDLFRQVHDWAMNLVRPPVPSRGIAAPALKAEGLEFGRAVRVGPYDIQPVRALGREALEGLNAWLSANGFPTEEPSHMAYFVDHKFTFLCIKVRPAEGEKSVAQSAGLVPLQLSFRTEQPYYPLRFSSRQGVFDVTLYAFTRDLFDFRRSGESLRRINWKDKGYQSNVAVGPELFPSALSKAYEKGGFAGRGGRWHLNVLQGIGVNQGDTIATWPDDLFFATVAPPMGAEDLLLPLAALGVLAFVIAAVVRRRAAARAG